MKYEILERIYEIQKNSGETFRVNKIGWTNNTTKFDLRLWNNSVPMQGITFTKEELTDFCTCILRYQGITTALHGSDEEYGINSDLSDIDLKELLERSQGFIIPGTKLKSLMKDLYPGRTIEVNLAYCAVECGITKQIALIPFISKMDLNRFLNLMENHYGIKKEYSFWAIKTWADAYDVRIENDITVMPSIHDNLPVQNSKQNQENKIARSGIRKGSTIYKDGNLYVSYDGITSQFEFCFTVDNKGAKAVRIDLSDVKVNGLDTKYYSFGITVPPKSKKTSRKLQLDYYYASTVLGIKKLKDIWSLRITLIYKYDGAKEKKKEYELYPDPN